MQSRNSFFFPQKKKQRHDTEQKNVMPLKFNFKTCFLRALLRIFTINLKHGNLFFIEFTLGKCYTRFLIGQKLW